MQPTWENVRLAQFFSKGLNLRLFLISILLFRPKYSEIGGKIEFLHYLANLGRCTLYSKTDQKF